MSFDLARTLRSSTALLVVVVLAATFAAAARALARVETYGGGAWCWFADPRAIFDAGQTYAGWIDRDGYIVVATVGPKGSTRTRIARLGTSAVHDDHDDPSLLVERDGRITAFYSHHSGRHMFWRTTRNAHDIRAWGPQHTLHGPRSMKYTYPNPVTLTAENQTYLFWRGSGQPTFSRRDSTGNWSAPQKFIEGGRQVPYVKVDSNGRDTIDFAFTDGHPGAAVTSIYFLEYRSGAFYKADGTRVGSMDSLPLQPSQADQVYSARQHGNVESWIHDVAWTPDGHPVVVYAVFPHNGHAHRYRYARWNGDAWATHDLGSAGGPITHGTEPFYSGGVVLDHRDPSIVYASVGRGNHHQIERMTTRDGGRSWRRTWMTSGPHTNNLRPVVPRNLPRGKDELLWMRGSYGRFFTFRTSIVGRLVALPR